MGHENGRAKGGYAEEKRTHRQLRDTADHVTAGAATSESGAEQQQHAACESGQVPLGHGIAELCPPHGWHGTLVLLRLSLTQQHGRHATADEHADAFYGYYTIHTLENGEVVGMLSVNGFTGQVFPHTWHGELVEMGDEADH